MLKINSIAKNIKLDYTRFKNIHTPTIPKAPYKTAAIGIALASLPVVLSTKAKDFSKTLEENFFQLKTNPKTNKPYEPDVFQTTSANHLFLGDDLLVTAPTGTGKTAIASYAMTKNLKDGKRTFYTTPLKALSNEKFRDFSKIYGEENVGLLTGDTKINTNAPIIVMTTEVYSNMVKSQYFDMSQNSRQHLPQDLKTVIFDELQYLGDIDRGGVWESSLMFTPKNVQILSLSATAKNADKINTWVSNIRGTQELKAEIDGNIKTNPTEVPRSVWLDVPSENRHVPLEIELEHVLPITKKNAKNGTPPKKLKRKSISSLGATPIDGSYINLTKSLREKDQLPAIYFVFSKKESRRLLQFLTEEGENLTTQEEKETIKQIIDKYEKNGKYLGETLPVESLLKGYAIHNAGMLPNQKELIEDLFQKKLVKVTIATETLSAGINMPARTTVITSPRKPTTVGDGGEDGKRNLSPNEFHQMAGRAGRRGIDTKGFCYPLACNKEQTKLFEELKLKSANNLESNFKFDFAFVANYLANFSNDDEIKYIISKTLFAHNAQRKAEILFDEYKLRKDLLLKEGYIENGRLTLKGELLKHINGYEQLPIINLVESKQLEDFSPSELCGIFGGLANLQYSEAGRFPRKPFEIDNESEKLSNLADNLANDIMIYSEKMQPVYPKIEISLDTNSINHLYEWAELNSKSDKSITNWKNLYHGKLKATIKDEGTLFREIMTTIDLMKQVSQIADVAKKYSENDAEKEYYSKLQTNLNTAIKLIQKQPASPDLI